MHQILQEVVRARLTSRQTIEARESTVVEYAHGLAWRISDQGFVGRADADEVQSVAQMLAARREAITPRVARTTLAVVGPLQELGRLAEARDPR